MPLVLIRDKQSPEVGLARHFSFLGISLNLHTASTAMVVIQFLLRAAFKPARDRGFHKGKRAIEVTFSLTFPGTSLQKGFLNQPRLKLTGLGSSDSMASELSAFSVLYRCRLRQSDLILSFEGKLT